MISNNSDIIKLRSIELSDLHKIKKWRNLQSIQPFVREYRELNLGDVESWYESINSNIKLEFFMIQDKEERDIGVTGLTNIDWVNRHADIHLGLYEESWGSHKWGLPTIKNMLDYGFNYLNLNKIYTEIYEIDNAKLDLFKNYGFNIDASLREHYYHKGEYHTSHILSFLHNQYLNLK